MDIRGGNISVTQTEADWLVVSVTEPVEITGALEKLDHALGGLVMRLKASNDLTGKLASIIPLRGVTGIAARRLLFVGLGKAEELTAGRLDKALVTAARAISDKPATRVAFVVPRSRPQNLLVQRRWRFRLALWDRIYFARKETVIPSLRWRSFRQTVVLQV